MLYNNVMLPRFCNPFLCLGCMTRVLAIWEIELTTILGIEPIGHRKRIMKSIRDLKSLQKSLDEAEKMKVYRARSFELRSLVTFAECKPHSIVG